MCHIGRDCRRGERDATAEERSDFGVTSWSGEAVVARDCVAWRRRTSGPKSPGGMAKSEKKVISELLVYQFNITVHFPFQRLRTCSPKSSGFCLNKISNTTELANGIYIILKFYHIQKTF